MAAQPTLESFDVGEENLRRYFCLALRAKTLPERRAATLTEIVWNAMDGDGFIPEERVHDYGDSMQRLREFGLLRQEWKNRYIGYRVNEAAVREMAAANV